MENGNITYSNNEKGNKAHLAKGAPDGKGGQFTSQKDLESSTKEEILDRQGEEYSKRTSQIKQIVANKVPFEKWAVNKNGSLNKNGRTFLDMYFYTPFFKKQFLNKVVDLFKNDLDEETPYVEIENDIDDKDGADFVIFLKSGKKICIDLKTTRTECNFYDSNKIVENLNNKKLPVFREFKSKNKEWEGKETTVFKNNGTNLFYMMNIVVDKNNNIQPKEMYEMFLNDETEDKKNYYDKVFSSIISSRGKGVVKTSLLRKLEKAGLNKDVIQNFHNDAKEILKSGNANLFNTQNESNYKIGKNKVYKEYLGENGEKYTVSTSKKPEGNYETTISFK